MDSNGLFGSVWNHKRLLSKTDLSPWSVGISLSHQQCKAVGRTWNYGCGSHPESRVKAHVPWATPRSLARNMVHPHYLHQWYWGKNPHNLQSSPIISNHLQSSPIISNHLQSSPIISNNQYCHASFFFLSHGFRHLHSSPASLGARRHLAPPRRQGRQRRAALAWLLVIMMGVFR